MTSRNRKIITSIYNIAKWLLILDFYDPR